MNVLSGGWHQLFPLGNPRSEDKNRSWAFPSVIFDSGGRSADALYAIFVHGDATSPRRAVLCKSANGITDWHVIGTDVPEGMESSPGVRLGNRLWLIGGSAADPAKISNEVYYYDLADPKHGWRGVDTLTGFAPGGRMGHACVVVDDNTIWVLGGLDEQHICLNDVWSLTITERNGSVTAVAAKKLSENSEWKPRCMFSAFKHNQKIWVCGGVSAPNGVPLGDIWNSSVSPVSWKNPGCSKQFKNAIGAGATTCGSTMFKVFRTREWTGNSWGLESLMAQLNKATDTTSWDESAFRYQTDDQWGKWTSTPHSMAVVGFQDRLYLRSLHRNALYGENVTSAPMFVYVRE